MCLLSFTTQRWKRCFLTHFIPPRAGEHPPFRAQLLRVGADLLPCVSSLANLWAQRPTVFPSVSSTFSPCWSCGSPDNRAFARVPLKAQMTEPGPAHPPLTGAQHTSQVDEGFPPFLPHRLAAASKDVRTDLQSHTVSKPFALYSNSVFLVLATCCAPSKP